jgi:hydroxyacylglutathione hydrolase
MEIERFIVTRGDNYNYILFCDKEKTAIAIDPLENEKIEALLKAREYALTHILITHGHGDHTMGAQALSEATGAEIIGHRDISIVNNPISNKKFLCGTVEVQPFLTPGHTSDSICYLIKDKIFTGDTLFFAGAGNCYNGSVDDLYDSFSQILLTFPDSTRVYPGHEYAVRNLQFALSLEPDNKVIQKRISEVKNNVTPPSTIAEERSYNPFLRFKDETFIEVLEIKINAIITDQKEAFLITRVTQ